jgi:hypothetical protein
MLMLLGVSEIVLLEAKIIDIQNSGVDDEYFNLKYEPIVFLGLKADISRRYC